eukprot:CAMPEP_0181425474 /NCGR_PEP_ID=MMETSP1110-20121109/15175_1 /TAXON_ID=174948 /ORGANISM="Symbiodinium sp., Strain CCMP421" /LENGTH=553 /DNA_ID=CAMNT_0023548657 /DNA_START=70 /DNA_END=1731 /DNA_ORIENTATION=-
MAATGAEAADRSLLEGAAPTGDASYGATGSQPSGEREGQGERPRMSPEEVMAEVMRNADEYKRIIWNAFLKGLAPLFAEAMGTFVLVFCVGCAVTSPTPSPWAPVAIASVLTVMVYATSNISGGHLNPAVTFAMALLGKKSWSSVVSYWLFQFMGAFSAAAAYKIVCAPHLAVVAPVPPFHAGYAIGTEMIYTGLLVFTVLSCAVSKRNNPPSDPNQFFGLAIGFAALAGGFACGHISGAALNPAVAVTLGLGSGKDPHWALTWFGAELAGATMGAALFRMLRANEFASGEEAPEAEGEPPAPDYKLRCLAEFVGTFVLVLTVGLNVVSGSRATAYSAAAVLMCMICSVGDISGGHFNPAVTVAVLLSGREKILRPDAVRYVGAQLAAGALAGLVYAFYHLGSGVADKSIKLVPGKGYDTTQAALAELITTGVLAYTVLTVATVKDYKTRDVAGLVIAFALTGGSFAVGSVSGGELNPSVVLGLVLGNAINPGKGGMGPVLNWMALLTCEFLGGMVASGVFRFTHRKEFMAPEDKETVKGLNEEADEDVESQS